MREKGEGEWEDVYTPVIEEGNYIYIYLYRYIINNFIIYNKII